MLRITTYILTLGLIVTILAIIAASTVYLVLAQKLPSTAQLKETQLQVPLRIFRSHAQRLN